jgi:hypothetical protein
MPQSRTHLRPTSGSIRAIWSHSEYRRRVRICASLSSYLALKRFAAHQWPPACSFLLLTVYLSMGVVEVMISVSKILGLMLLSLSAVIVLPIVVALLFFGLTALTAALGARQLKSGQARRTAAPRRR